MEEDNLPEGVMSELKKITSSFDETNARIAEVTARQDNEIKELGGSSTALATELKKLEARYDQEIADYKGTSAELKAEIAELKEQCVEAELKAREAAAKPSGRGRKSVAEAIEAAEEFKHWSIESKRDSPSIDLGSIGDYRRQRKDIVGGDALRSVLAQTHWMQIYGEQFTDKVHLREYMDVQSGTGHSYVYAVNTAYTNGAEFTAEFDLKPDSEMTFEDRVCNSHTIAHTMNISTQQARETPQLTRFVENNMIEGLFDKESRALLFADGTGASFLGIANTPGVQAYSRAVSGDTFIDALRRSDTQLQDVNAVGNLYVVNHRDWEAIELAKNDELDYIWVNIQEGGTPRMWRKPVFATRAMTEGSFLNGNFREGATLVDFQRANVQLFTQHADYAKRNLILVRAEEAIGLAVVNPHMFVMGDYASGS